MSSESNQRGVSGPVLVTGATGFVGRNLVSRLVNLGEQIHVILRSERSGARLVEPHPNLQLHYCDLRNGPRLREIVQAVKPKTVFHCATYGAYNAQTDVAEVFSINWLGTINLLQAVSTVEYDVLVNTGSFFEYGANAITALDTTIPERLSSYAASKLAATLYCQMLACVEGQPVVTLRLFYPYGPYENPNRLIPSVIRAAFEGRDVNLTLGDQARDFIYIHDVVEAYLKAAEIGGPVGDIVDIGTGNEHTVKEVVERILSLLDSTVTPLWGTSQKRGFEIMKCKANIVPASRLLGWAPGYNLTKGLQETIAWHRSVFTSQ